MKLRQVEGVGILVWVYLFMGLSGFVYPAVWSYVAIGKFGWSEGQIGASLAYYGVIYVICQAVMVPYVLPRLGQRRTIWIALSLEVFALIVLAFAPSGHFVYAILLLALFTGMQDPALMSIMTERVGKDAQGELQGGLAALGGVILAIAPLMYTQLFFLFESGAAGVQFAGAPFLMSAGMSAMALLLFLSRKRASA
jgi:DHA1 family tetracycline resistance protein-like MFS transporter